MEAHRVMKYLHPDLEIDKDYTLQDDGEGVYVSEWKSNKQKPTKQELLNTWTSISSSSLYNPPPPSTQGELLASAMLQLAQKELRIRTLEKQNASILLKLAQGGL